MRQPCPPRLSTEAAAALGARLEAAVRQVPDFPRPGIVFRDITTAIGDGALFRDSVDALAGAFGDRDVELVAGIEARGFVVGGAIAYLLGAGFVPVRKQGRLPAHVESAAYALEYGEAVLEVHRDAIHPGQRVLIVDDLLATGGTASATIDLVQRLGATVAGLAFLIELAGLGGLATLGAHDVVALVTI